MSEPQNERELQTQIVQYLEKQGIKVLWHRSDKRSRATTGWPDLTFCIKIYQGSLVGSLPYPFAWEVKFGKGKLSPEQEKISSRLIANGWNWALITSLEEAMQKLWRVGFR